MERIFADDWTLRPCSIRLHNFQFRDTDYVKGQLGRKLGVYGPKHFCNPSAQGVHWQNIPPANGREFIADDVVYHYNRMYGLGGGFTNPSPYSCHRSKFSKPDIGNCH